MTKKVIPEAKQLAVRCAFTKMVALRELKPHPENPNTHSEEQMAFFVEVLKYQGIRRAITVSKRSGFITRGHGLLEGIRRCGSTMAPVDFQDYDSVEQEIADIVADNELARLSTTDRKLLDAIALKLPEGFNLRLLAIPKYELPHVIGQGGGNCDEDQIPEPPKKVRSKLGDLFELGNHRVLCGDSTKVKEVERLMAGEMADMVFTDPPYNMASENDLVAASVSGAMKKLKASEWDKNFNPDEALARIYEALADDATVYICTSHHLAGAIWKWMKAWPKGSSCDGYCLWAKPNPMPSLMKRHWTWSSELICYATRGKHIFNFPEGGHALNVWTITKHSDGTHPTQKPVELCEHAIKHSSLQNHRVLDLFLGSGSTLIACEKTRRRCFGMEIDPQYCDVIIERWQTFAGKKAYRLNADGGKTAWDALKPG